MTSSATRPLKILFAAAEVNPFYKVGGLADVAGSLPRALAGLGHDVRVIVPHHGGYTQTPPWLAEPRASFSTTTQGRTDSVSLREAVMGEGVPVYFLQSPRLAARPLYGARNEAELFLFVSQAIMEALRHLDWQPEVVHLHDWHPAPAAFLLRQDQTFADSAIVLTIHNISVQGIVDARFVAQASLPPAAFWLPGKSPPYFSFMALGILHADAVNTVSPTYAKELLTPEFGMGLDPLLRHRGDLVGILNGIDYGEFDPATDPHLPARFDASSIERRAINKAALQHHCGLPQDPEVPLLGVVTRLYQQKGLDILEEAFGTLLTELPLQLAVLGTGDAKYETLMAGMAKKFPEKVAARLEYNAPLAQQIYGGCDIFLVPSRFEPCGLTQMIALRYGAVPLVRRTGGLADTIVDCQEDPEAGNGFVFTEYRASALAEAVRRALAAFGDKDFWRRLVGRGMAEDFSWDVSARSYVELYQQALSSRAR